MSCLGNVLWFLFGGLWLGLGWCLVGVLWCVSTIGIPVGVQCFKFAALAFFPFGKDIDAYGGVGSVLLNILWLLLGGLVLALEAAVVGLVFCVTVVGVPFGLQCFKLARLALAPFGSRVYVR